MSRVLCDLWWHRFDCRPRFSNFRNSAGALDTMDADPFIRGVLAPVAAPVALCSGGGGPGGSARMATALSTNNKLHGGWLIKSTPKISLGGSLSVEGQSIMRGLFLFGGRGSVPPPPGRGPDHPLQTKGGGLEPGESRPPLPAQFVQHMCKCRNRPSFASFSYKNPPRPVPHPGEWCGAGGAPF